MLMGKKKKKYYDDVKHELLNEWEFNERIPSKISTSMLCDEEQ
jgi:hypothetical protein